MNRIITLVIDGFGIGAMKDCAKVRPQDVGSNTLRSILEVYPDLTLSTLASLGLMNAYGHESKNMKFSSMANYGRIALQHDGADTFAGHQEIMGTIPSKPIIAPFQDVLEDVIKNLSKHGHEVKIIEKEGLYCLLVDRVVFVGDNIDADFGMAYNCTAPLDLISFEKEVEIAKLVREVSKVTRVIPFGGHGTTLENLYDALMTCEHRYIGVHAVKSKSYVCDYHVQHLGYGVNPLVQVPAMLSKKNIAISLFGKVADIVENPYGKCISCVDTKRVLELTIEEIKHMKYGYICTNVQQSDLAGHSEDVLWYRKVLEEVDCQVAKMLPLFNEQDMLIICADHGNDPCVGHNHHTREYVPLLVYQKGCNGKQLHERSTLSDIGASICDLFHTQKCANGKSFANKLGEGNS